MNTTKDIEKSVVSLSKSELNEFRTWFAEFDSENWDLQIESDVDCGRLEKLGQTALKAYHDKKTTEI